MYVTGILLSIMGAAKKSTCFTISNCRNGIAAMLQSSLHLS